MGVDVVVMCNPGREVSASEMESLNWAFCEANGYEPSYGMPLCAVDEDDSHWFESCPGAGIRLHTLDRYYGPGYERGPWPRIAGHIEWLRHRFPDGKVWYGGDSGDTLNKVTDAFMAGMWKHWATVGGEPYRRGGLAGDGAPKCCGGTIYVNGFCGAERMGYCPVCGKRWKTKRGEWNVVDSDS